MRRHASSIWLFASSMTTFSTRELPVHANDTASHAPQNECGSRKTLDAQDDENDVFLCCVSSNRSGKNQKEKKKSHARNRADGQASGQGCECVMGKPKTRGMILRPPPELSFQFRVVDLDQGGPAVWAAVGHVAFEGVLKKFLQLFVVKRVVRFHSVATNGGGDHVFAEAEFGHAITGGPDLVDDLLEKALWIVALQKGGEGVDLQRSSTKWFSGETKLVECFEI